MERIDIESFDAEFEREVVKDDDSAARAIHALGQPIHISREDTPDGYVVRVYPDGKEELIPVDLEELAASLGR